MEHVNGLHGGRESRQDVVQNDKISLGDLAPEGVVISTLVLSTP